MLAGPRSPEGSREASIPCFWGLPAAWAFLGLQMRPARVCLCHHEVSSLSVSVSSSHKDMSQVGLGPALIEYDVILIWR